MQQKKLTKLLQSLKKSKKLNSENFNDIKVAVKVANKVALGLQEDLKMDLSLALLTKCKDLATYAEKIHRLAQVSSVSPFAEI